MAEQVPTPYAVARAYAEGVLPEGPDHLREELVSLAARSFSEHAAESLRALAAEVSSLAADGSMGSEQSLAAERLVGMLLAAADDHGRVAYGLAPRFPSRTRLPW